MCKLFNLTLISTYACLCLFAIGCASYTPYHYRFSLIEPKSDSRHPEADGKVMNFEDSDVKFSFVPAPENIYTTIKNKTDRKIFLVRDRAEYIDPSGKSHSVHYGSDYAQEVKNFIQDNTIMPMRIDPGSEINGYLWLNIWPDFCIGDSRTTISDIQINYLREPIFPRHSFEGSVKDLKNSSFNLLLPIDFGGYVRNYTFTFMIDDVF